jgi:2-haloacid dehalogenase
VETTTGEYRSFGEIGAAALVMVAETNQIELEYDKAKKLFVSSLRSLPPHDDVVEGLQALRQAGYHIVSLTNSSAEGVEAQLRHARIYDLFEKRYSVETVRKFKPHPDTYRSVLTDLNIPAEDALMVAAHAWDLVGAKNVGLQTAFIKRPGKTLYQHAQRPDYVVNDLRELAKVLQPGDSKANE